jgi:hypothetical protein
MGWAGSIASVAESSRPGGLLPVLRGGTIEPADVDCY